MSDALFRELVAAASGQLARDMARHTGERIHEIVKAQAMLMPTVSLAAAVGVLVAHQTLEEAVQFACNSMDGDKSDEAAIESALRALFASLTPVTTTPSPTLDEAAIVERCARVADRIARRADDEVSSYDSYGGPPLSGRDQEAQRRDAAKDIAAAIRREGVTAVGHRDCEVCGGDCSSANPPMMYCPIRDGRTPTPNAAADALDWFSTQHALELSHKHPVYGDDDDQDEEWQVHRQSGSVNDREWDLVGRGATATEAIIAALAQYRQQQPGTSHLNDEGKA